MVKRFEKCPNCFKSYEGQGICEHCGFNIEEYKIPENVLPPFTVLEGKYMLGRTLGVGGFGITYLGWDMNLETKIAIKEYYPGSFVFRDTTKEDTTQITVTGSNQDMYDKGLKRYVEEAKNLSKFYNLPGIVSVKDFFYANKTAYMVMEHVDGITLKAHLEKMGGKMEEETVLTLMRPIIESLQQVHEKGMVHRDISPDNIMVDGEGKIKLIDFGSVRGQSLESDMTYTVILKHGYAPQEQYYAKGKQGPWTDVYSLCATMYKMLTGQIPPNSIERMSGDTYLSPSTCGVKVSAKTERVLNKGLAPLIENRYQNLGQLKDALYNSDEETQQGIAQSNERTVLINSDIATNAGYSGVPQQGAAGMMQQNNVGMAQQYTGNYGQQGNTVLVNQPMQQNSVSQQPAWGNAPVGQMAFSQPVGQAVQPMGQGINQQYQGTKKKNIIPIVIVAFLVVVIGVVAVVVSSPNKNNDKKTTSEVVENTRESRDDEEDVETADEGTVEVVAEEPEEEVDIISSEWRDYVAEIGGETYQFPMTYSDYESKGWDINFDGDELYSGEIREFTCMDGNTDFGIIVANYSDEQKSADECSVIGIRINSSWNLSYEDSYIITLPGGVSFDLVDPSMSYTMAEIEALYGEPDTIDDFDRKKKYTDATGFVEFSYGEDGSCGGVLYCCLETPVGEAVVGNVYYSDMLPMIAGYQMPADTADRFDAVMKICNVNYKLPVPVSEFINNGWSVVDELSTFAPLEQKYVEMYNSSTDSTIWVYINNYSIYSVDVGNLYVDYIYVSSFECADGVVYPGNIKYGESLENVEALFGDIDNSYKTVEDMGDYYQVKVYYPVYDGSIRMTYYFEEDAAGTYCLTDGYYWRDVTSQATWVNNTDYIQGITIE